MSSLGLITSLLRRAADWIFGYDFFISYSHEDGLNYPRQLKEDLEVAGFKVFRDLEVYVAGEDLPKSTRRRVRMSRKLVVVTREAALRSDWVAREIGVFQEKGGIPIVINVNCAIDAEPRSELAKTIWAADWLRLDESLDDPDGRASEKVIQELIRAFDSTRQETKRLRIIGGSAIGFALVALAAVAGWKVATIQREAAIRNEQLAISGQVDLHVQTGMKAIDDGNFWAAAVWFSEALRVDHDRGDPETDHRTRLASVAKRLPSLQSVWFVDSAPSEIRFLPKGRRLVVVSQGVKVYSPREPDGIALDGSQGFLHSLDLDAPGGNVVRAVMSTYSDESGRASHEAVNWNATTAEKTTVVNLRRDARIAYSALGDRLLIQDKARLQIRSGTSEEKYWSQPWSSPTDAWRRVALTPDGKLLIATTDQEIWSRGTDPDAEPKKLYFGDHFGEVYLDRGNQWFAVAGKEEFFIFHRTQLNNDPIRLDIAGAVENFEEIAYLDFSPDGEHLVVAVEVKEGNRTSLVWHLSPDGNAELQVQIPHERAVARWEFTPPSVFDGGTGAGAATVMGFSRVNPFEKIVRFSPDGRLLAAASEVDEMVRVWNWREERAVTPPLGYLGGGVTSFAFTPDGAGIAVATRDHVIRLWDIDLTDGDALPLEGTDRVDILEIFDGGRRLAYSGYRPVTTVQEISGAFEALSLRGHTAAIDALAISNFGRFLATGGYDQTARVFELEKGENLCPPLEHAHAVHGLAFHGESKLVTFASEWEGPSEVRVWELPSGELIRKLHLPDRRVEAVVFNSDGTQVAIRLARRTPASLDEETRLELSRPIVWDLNLDVTSLLAIDSAAEVEWIKFAETGSRVWTYSRGRIEQFDTISGAMLDSVPIESPFKRLLCVSHDGRKAAVGKWGNQVQVVDLKSGAVLTPQMDHPPRSAVEHGEFSKDGSRLLTIADEQVRIWSAETADLLAPPFVHDVRVNDATLDEEGKILAISVYPRRDGWAGMPSRIHLWSLDEVTASVEVLSLRATLESGHQVDRAGGYVPLGKAELKDQWARYVGMEGISSSTARRILWHRQQGAKGDAFGKRFHDSQLANVLGERLSSEPSNVRLREQRAGLLIRSKRFEEALRDLSKLIELEPKNAERISNRAGLLVRMGRLKDALQDLSTLVGEDPLDPKRLAKRAHLNLKLNRPRDTLRDLDAALKVMPRDRKLRRFYAEVAWGLGDHADAVRQMRVSVGLDESGPPDQLESADFRDLYQVAFLALKAGDQKTYSDACQRGVQMLRDWPKWGSLGTEQWNAMFFAGWMFVAGAESVLREDEWNEVLNRLNNFADADGFSYKKDARLLRGAVLVRKGEFDSAEAELSTLEMPPFDQLFLAIAAGRLERGADVAKLLSRAREGIRTIRENRGNRQMPPSAVLSPNWPDDPDVAEFLADEATRYGSH